MLLLQSWVMSWRVIFLFATSTENLIFHHLGIESTRDVVACILTYNSTNPCLGKQMQLQNYCYVYSLCIFFHLLYNYNNSNKYTEFHDKLKEDNYLTLWQFKSFPKINEMFFLQRLKIIQEGEVTSANTNYSLVLNNVLKTKGYNIIILFFIIT